MSEEIVNSLKVFVDDFGVNIHTKQALAVVFEELGCIELYLAKLEPT